MTKNISILLIKLLLLLCFVDTQSKNDSLKPIICADSIGPRLIFQVPFFKNPNQEETFFLKYYDLKNRNNFEKLDGKILKRKRSKSSNYFFYDGYFFLDKKKSEKKYFRFFPPSTLMLDVIISSSDTLACWEE